MQKFAPSLLAIGLVTALVGCQEHGPQDEKITINIKPNTSTHKLVTTQSTLIPNAPVCPAIVEHIDF